MVRRGVAGVLDAKFFDDKREHYGQVGLCLEQRRTGDGGIYVFGEMKSEAVVGNDAGLLEAGHDFSYLEVDPAVRGKCEKVLLRGYLIRDGVEGQTHVLLAVHGCIIIENFNV